MGLVTRPDVDIVVEVIGGIEPVRSVLLAAMKSGKAVISANKALLAEDGATLHEAARGNGVNLYYEAAVAGAIPLLRPLRESLAGDAVHRVLGIVNGTTNYILDRMDTSGAGFADALDEAQSLGYAEPDPTADIEGFDAAAKAAILAGLAFHTGVTAADVYREGITGVTAADIASAQALGRVVEAAGHLRAAPRGCLGPRAPGDDPAQPSAGRRAGRLQRGVRRGRGSGPADVLRGRRREACPPRARCSATWSRWPATWSPGPAGRTRPPTRSCACCPWVTR